MQYFVDLCNVISQDLQEILLVLDGTTGLNMLPQAREFNEVIFLSFACFIKEALVPLFFG